MSSELVLTAGTATHSLIKLEIWMITNVMGTKRSDSARNRGERRKTEEYLWARPGPNSSGGLLKGG